MVMRLKGLDAQGRKFSVSSLAFDVFLTFHIVGHDKGWGPALLR